MIVLDTHAWFWWLVSPRKLSRAAARAIERADEICICTVSVFELADQAERGRVRLDPSTRAWVHDALAQERVVPVPLTVEVALDAAQLRFVGDPVDRVIYATARAADAQLVTRDERLRAFDAQVTVW